MRFLPHRHAGLEPGPAFLLATAVALASPAQAQPSGPPAATDYTRPANWLCRPGRDDVCARQPLVTALLPTGYGAKTPAPRLVDPVVDCFYVYPTVSHDRGLNSDLIPDDGARRQSRFQNIESAHARAIVFSRRIFACNCNTP